jgi:hypothetical protein
MGRALGAEKLAKTSRLKRRKKLQSKTEAAARTYDGGHPGIACGIELNLKKIAGIQQNSGIKDHTSLAELDTPAGNHGRGKSSCRHDSDRHIDGQTRPAAGIGGSHLHTRNPCLSAIPLQITKVQLSP